MNEQVVRVIERVKGKGGESYDHEGHGHGWRNPIRDDTGEILRGLVLAEHPNRIIEFGTAYGLSGLYLASGFNGNGGNMVTIEFNPEVATTSAAELQRGAIAGSGSIRQSRERGGRAEWSVRHGVSRCKQGRLLKAASGRSAPVAPWYCGGCRQRDR